MRDALIRIGRIAEPPVEPIIPAASLYHYRNKLEYSFTSGDEGASSSASTARVAGTR